MANPRIPARRGHKHKNGDLEGDFTISGNWDFSGDTGFSGDVRFEQARSGDTHSFVVENSNPQIMFYDTSGPGTDEAKWNVGSSTSAFFIRTLDDTGANGETWLQANRTGTAVDNLRISTDLEVRSGHNLTVYDSSNTDRLEISHNGTDVNFDHAGTTDWNINDLEFIRLFDGVTIQARDGGRLNALSTDDGSSCSIRHNDTDGVVEASGGGLQLAGGHDANIYVAQTSLSDDETDTFTLPDSRKGAFCFMTAQTTTGTANAGWHAFFWVARASETPVQISVGANFDIGDGSNNDTDGVVNVWMGSNGVISVKNRDGNTRRICLYALTN